MATRPGAGPVTLSVSHPDLDCECVIDATGVSFWPSSFRNSLLKRRPLGSLPMKRCTYSVPWSCTATAYFRGLTQDCRQNGTFVSPTVCLGDTNRRTPLNPQHFFYFVPELEFSKFLWGFIPELNVNGAVRPNISFGGEESTTRNLWMHK